MDVDSSLGVACDPSLNFDIALVCKLWPYLYMDTYMDTYMLYRITLCQ